MSRDKQIYEAQRWLGTAMEDLDAARALLEKQKFSHSCFFSQQSAEKTLKALWIFFGEDPWGHSIHKLMTEFPDPQTRELFEEVIEEGSVLDRYYIPTRYPSGLPDMTPGKYYFQKDALLCIASAERILDKVCTIMKK